jgi:hypothetical protein
MDIKTLEEEYTALLSDRAGEIEYLQSLQKQIKQLKVNVVNSFSLHFAEIRVLKVNVVNSFSLHFAEIRVSYLLDEMVVKEVAKAGFSLGRALK